MKRWLVWIVIWMMAFLSASCVMTSSPSSSISTTSTSTSTSTSTIPQSMTRLDMIAELARYAEAIVSLSAYGPEGYPNPDNVASTTFLRSELVSMPISTGMSWMGDTRMVANALSTSLKDCDPSADSIVCHRQEGGIETRIRHTVTDGWLKFEYLTVETFVVGPIVSRVFKYEGLELSLWSEAIAFRHRTIVSVDKPLDRPELTKQAVYHSDGSYEIWQATPNTLSKTTHDATTRITTHVSLGPLNRIAVRKWFLADGIAHMGTYDVPEQVRSQSVHFGSDTTIFSYLQSPDDPAIVTLQWNALDVDGWDRLTFDGESNAFLYQGETRPSGDYFVAASVWGRHTNASLIMLRETSELDESVLSLSMWGLHFDGVTMEELMAALAVLPASGFDWIVAEGFSFDRAETMSVFASRMVVTIDEAWIASLLED